MLLNGILLIVLSLVAVPSLFLAKKPDAKKYLDKILPYQGWAGVVFCIWGIIELVQTFLHISIMSLGTIGVIAWLTALLYAVVETTLGFILGYNLIAKYALKGEAAQKKGEQVLAKLQSVQGKLGILGLIVGVWCIVASIILVVA